MVGLEEEYRNAELDRNWWGNFGDSLHLVDKDFPETSDIYQLIPVCARIALHIAGEFPQISFSRERKIFGDFEYILLNQELLYLKLPDVIRTAVFFGNFIHQLGHFVYSRQAYAEKSYTSEQAAFVHLIEDRRIESKLVEAYPGYYDYLYSARKLAFVLVLNRVADEMKFPDLSSLRFHYVAGRIAYPELFRYETFAAKFKPHFARLHRIDELLESITDYRALSACQVLEYGRILCRECGVEPKEGEPMFNYYSKVMKNLPLETEGKQVNIDVKIFDDLFQDLNRSLDLESTRYVPEEGGRVGEKDPARIIGQEVVESEAESGNIIPSVLSEAKKIAGRIRLNFLTFQAKMNKTCVIYEQEEGELDEDELYRVKFNRNVFIEEAAAPSAALEVIILLDLSGSMMDEEKIRMQMTLSVALALAFEGNPGIRFSIYGHRVNQGRLHIVRYYEAGKRLQINRLFTQEGAYTNADGMAIEYCLQKFGAKASNKLVFVISDGHPTVASGKQDPRKQVREVVRRAKRKGIEVLSIGISNFDQGDMYDEFIPYSGLDIPIQLIGWLKKKFNNIADGANF